MSPNTQNELSKMFFVGEETKKKKKKKLLQLFHLVVLPNTFPFTDLGKLDLVYFTNLLIDLLVF